MAALLNPKVRSRVWGQDVTRKFLPFFPSGFDDETLSSRVSEYHILSGHDTTRETYLELFHTAPFPLSYWIPPHLDKLAIQIPGNVHEQLRCLYEQGTLFPLFRLFFRDRLGQSLDRLCLATGRAPRRILGESGSTRLCIECLIEDKVEYGKPIIHLSHNIPATTTCWKHGARLIDRCPVCRCPIEVSRDLPLVPWTGCLCGHDLSATTANDKGSEPTEFEISFARFGRELLKAAVSMNIGTRQLIGLYKQRIASLGLCRGSRIDRKELGAALIEHVGPDVLAGIDWAYRNGKGVEWSHTWSCQAACDTPLNRHLVLSHFLFREAAQFVAAVAMGPSGAKAPENQNHVTRRRPGTDELSKDELFERSMTNIVALVREHGYTVDDLWKLEYGTMKRLVRWNPQAVQILEGKLARSSRRVGSRKKIQMEAAINSETDLKWAASIEEAARRLFGSQERPRRITMNQLLIEAGLRRHGWPTEQTFPRTRHAAEELSESRWHFYARKLLWTMRRIPIDSMGKTSIAVAAGLASVKASDVIRYFIDRGYRPTAEHPMAQIERLGISKQWTGPNPDRQYGKEGRSYIRKGGQKTLN